ncbi:MAG: hypothetical protein RLZ25_121 [Pseudomonadota bacterium]
MLLTQLFRLQAATAKSVSPGLTIPVCLMVYSVWGAPQRVWIKRPNGAKEVSGSSIHRGRKNLLEGFDTCSGHFSETGELSGVFQEIIAVT